MQIADLKGKNIVIWGLGHEGKAAAVFIRKAVPDAAITFVDEVETGDVPQGLPTNSKVVRGAENITAIINAADILVKSPGVSLYHPLIRGLKEKGVPVTSLLNLWIAQPRKAKIICVTGTKGKSTTSALLVHTLNGLGKKTAFGGNIGVPVAEITGDEYEYAVIEVSSYQAADFNGNCDIAVLTSLRPEHLDWHGSEAKYFEDKLNLLSRAKTRIVNCETLDVVEDSGLASPSMLVFNVPEAMHVKDGKLYDGEHLIGTTRNTHLARPHNLSNICGVLTALKLLGFDPAKALVAMEDFHGLPHRQQELGERDGVLYVNDSIATAPHAAIAALEVYGNRPVTLIAGGYDRGVNYSPLIDYILKANTHAIICIGPSGKRISDGLVQARQKNIFNAASMQEAIALARQHTPKGGVVLLSPAAPSFGLFRDYAERGARFAAESGFALSAVKK